MNEPQVWTLIGVFAAGLFGMLTLMSTMFVRVVRSEISGVRSEVGSVRSEIASVRDTVTAEIGSVRAEIHRLDQRFDTLDRDVQAIAKRVFGADQA
ncbi:hypothetical protein ET475_04700 [Microbacterium protaetiae]|uniref:DUF2746 domain-containing protein n=1 Tax=Microbacterium protaetiae TaxID=2509458 RepID=A0A4P6EIA3_9MICO|nr:hypothetical protein ET475_04700 [Microbacterium protaetiae]